jgi:hypothetical protein
MNYDVLTPWADVDPVPPRGLVPRVTDLEGKTIGLYAFFKQHAPLVMREVERQLKERFPTALFRHFQYPVHVKEVLQDDDYRSSFEEFVSGVDAVITGNGD